MEFCPHISPMPLALERQSFFMKLTPCRLPPPPSLGALNLPPASTYSTTAHNCSDLACFIFVFHFHVSFLCTFFPQLLRGVRFLQAGYLVHFPPILSSHPSIISTDSSNPSTLHLSMHPFICADSGRTPRVRSEEGVPSLGVPTHPLGGPPSCPGELGPPTRAPQRVPRTPKRSIFFLGAFAPVLLSVKLKNNILILA